MLKIFKRQYRSWEELNLVLRQATTKEQCLALFEAEKNADKHRPAFLKRIHSRLNKVRADEERKELEKYNGAENSKTSND